MVVFNVHERSLSASLGDVGALLDRLVQTQVTGLLRPLGFRKGGRTYNRTVEDGLVHVVNLQAGPYELGDEIPGLRPNLWGPFTVNLGVYVPDLDPDPRIKAKARKSVPEYACAIRARMAHLLERDTDLWWPLGETWPESAADVVACLVEVGIRFLELFRTRDDVIRLWIDTAERLRLSNAARVDVARLRMAEGDLASARELLQWQYDRSSLKGHREYLIRLAADSGIELTT